MAGRIPGGAGVVWSVRMPIRIAVCALIAILRLALAPVSGIPAAVVHAADTRSEQTIRSRILIYYTNETSAQASGSENYTALLAVLRQSSNPLTTKLANSIVEDAGEFPAIVQRDIDALLTAARRLGVDFAVFTNAMTLQHEYLLYRAATAHAETRRLPELAETSDAILATSPLSRPDVFRAALLAVGSLYPPHAIDAVLIANSHGSSDMALMPRVNVDLSLTTPTEVLMRLSRSGVDDAEPTPAWAALKGTNKLEFWRVISEVSVARGMRFPLVFREACASGLASWAEFRAVPSSVDAIAHSAMGGLSPRKIDYTALSDVHGREAHWVDQVASSLQHYGIHVDTKQTMWIWVALITLGSIHPALFFMPLAVWLVWYGLSALAVHRRTACR